MPSWSAPSLIGSANGTATSNSGLAIKLKSPIKIGSLVVVGVLDAGGYSGQVIDDQGNNYQTIVVIENNAYTLSLWYSAISLPPLKTISYWPSTPGPHSPTNVTIYAELANLSGSAFALDPFVMAFSFGSSCVSGAPSGPGDLFVGVAAVNSGTIVPDSSWSGLGRFTGQHLYGDTFRQTYPAPMTLTPQFGSHANTSIIIAAFRPVLPNVAQAIIIG